MTATPTSSREHILALRAEGQTNRDIARVLGRSPSYVSKVATGAKPGNDLRGSLAEYRATGTVASPPPRRTRADGQPARVRISAAQAAKTGAKSAPPPPPPPAAKKPVAEVAPPARAGRYGASVTEFGGGARRVTVTAPKTDRGGGRDKARHALRQSFTRAAQGQRHGRKHITITVTTASGRTATIGQKGGYDASAILAKVKEGEDIYKAVQAEYEKAGQANQDFRAKNKSGSETEITGSDMIDYGSDPISTVELTMW